MLCDLRGTMINDLALNGGLHRTNPGIEAQAESTIYKGKKWRDGRRYVRRG